MEADDPDEPPNPPWRSADNVAHDERTAALYITLIALTALVCLMIVIGAVKPTPEALNPKLTDNIPHKGPTLYYNGSGPVPPYDELSPTPVPITPVKHSSKSETDFFNEIIQIVSGTASNCTKCMDSAAILTDASLSLPVSNVTGLLIRMWNEYRFSIFAENGVQEFSGVGGLGPYVAQAFSRMSNNTGDYRALCGFRYHYCTPPPVIEIDENIYFSPKPTHANVAPTSSGKSFNVLHLSDWHLDPRYDIGSEGNCSQNICCRHYSTNTRLYTTSNNASIPASRFGNMYCDSPPDLALSTFHYMDQFVKKSDISFTIFTGDIVSHDNDDLLSRSYVEYEEEVMFQVFKAEMGSSPIYATLGNHDTYPEGLNAQNTLNPASGKNAFSWNYELLSSLWEHSGWLNSSEASFAATHYGAYAHTTKEGLRIISFNTDFYYYANLFMYWNYSNPDTSGVLTWLAAELGACENRGQPAWIIGHIPSGYDGTSALPNGAALFQSIVVRFSPATIRGIFFGHTHEDQLQIFYDYAFDSINSSTGLRDTTKADYTKPLSIAKIGPSIVPLTGFNAGWALYQIDTLSFQVAGLQTYIANISESLEWTHPVWKFEYDARSTYSTEKWPHSAPLNATFWHGVTERMLENTTLVELYNLLETKSSVSTNPCVTEGCVQQKVCFMRSGSSTLSKACPQDTGPR